jgi:hypothetical protein
MTFKHTATRAPSLAELDPLPEDTSVCIQNPASPAMDASPSPAASPSPSPPPKTLDPLILTTRRVRHPTERARNADTGEDDLPEGPGRLTRVLLHVNQRVRTIVNKFGLTREYRRVPSAVPDEDIHWQSTRPDNTPPSSLKKRRSVAEIIYPYPNITSFLLNRFHKTTSRSTGRDELIETVLLHPDFRQDDVPRPSELNRIEKEIQQDVQNPWGTNGWKSSTAYIQVPNGIKPTKDSRRRASKKRDTDDQEVRIPIYDVRHRSLTHVMREVAHEDSSAKRFHWHGFEESWESPFPDIPSPQRVYGDLFTSEQFLRVERDLLSSPPEEGCELPRAVLAFMLWSDATHLAQFGHAKAWPIYLSFGNQTKYERAQPNLRPTHHVAFLPSARSQLLCIQYRAHHSTDVRFDPRRAQ